MGQLFRRVARHFARSFSVTFDRRCEMIGLHILNQRAQLTSFSGRRVTLIAKDVNDVAGLAAVWLSKQAMRGRVIECAHVYEYDGKIWRSAGGVAGSRSREWLTPARPSSILTREGGLAVRSYAGRLAERSMNGQDSGVSWVGCNMFYTSACVEYLEVQGRRIMVPDHGHVVVAWKGSSGDTIPPHPLIKAMDKGGICVAELAHNDVLDSHDLGSLADHTEP
jgi:hypothetical protein